MPDKVLLHVCDWNYQDKYYNVPLDILQEFAAKIKSANLTAPNLGGAWDWFIEQKDKGIVQRCDSVADHTVGPEEYFLDWVNPIESVAEWS